MEKILYTKEIYTPFEKIEQGAIRIRDGKISDIIANAPEDSFPPNIEFIDARDQIAVPGFVELHVNGAGGADVMEGSFDSLRRVADTLVRHGTTAFLPTVITASEPRIMRVLSELGKSLSIATTGAVPLGIHLEGPFISKTKRGTHPAEHLRAPDRKFLERAFQVSEGKLKILTLAPELEGGEELIESAVKMGITVALGHSDATYEQTIKAVDAGATHAVHIFNAMRSFQQREPGIVGALLTDDRISTAIITDGIHVHPAVIKTFAKTKRLGKIVLATDGTAATAMPDGEYWLGERSFHVKAGVCRDEEGRLAGSSLTQDAALRNLLAWTDLTFSQALSTATINPAQVLGMKNKGILAVGADADIVLLDSNLSVRRTIIQGRVLEI